MPYVDPKEIRVELYPGCLIDPEAQPGAKEIFPAEFKAIVSEKVSALWPACRIEFRECEMGTFVSREEDELGFDPDECPCPRFAMDPEASDDARIDMNYLLEAVLPRFG